MSRIVRVFLAGLLALLPLVATVAVTIWLAQFAIGYIGPNSTFGNLLTSIGLSLDRQALLPYLGGLAITLLAIYFFGLLVETRLGPWFHAFVDGLVLRIPVVGSFYQMSKRVIAVVDPKDDHGIKNMTPVWCFFGGEPGAAVLALLPSSAGIQLGNSNYLGVLVPSAPVPVGGALIYVPREWVKPADVGIDDLVSIYVSMGMTVPESLAPRGEQPPIGQASVADKVVG